MESICSTVPKSKIAHIREYENVYGWLKTCLKVNLTAPFYFSVPCGHPVLSVIFTSADDTM